MTKYEIMTLSRGTIGDVKAKDLVKKVTELITALGGKIIKNDSWGKRKLAYKILHETDGYYEVMEIELPGDKLDSLKKKLNLEDELLRYLITATS